MKQFNTLVIFGLFVLILSTTSYCNVIDSCETEIFSIKDTLSISVVSTKDCECSFAIHNNGFIIATTNLMYEEEIILWGEASGIIYHCQTLAFTIDMDKDGVNELFTLFIDDSNIWGYAHRFIVNDNFKVDIETYKIPFLLHNELKFPDFYRINADNSVTIFGETYAGQNNLEINTINNKISIK